MRPKILDHVALWVADRDPITDFVTERLTMHVIEKTAKGKTGLNTLMNGYRDRWMEELLTREVRIVDSQVTAALQNGTAFFASTSDC